MLIIVYILHQAGKNPKNTLHLQIYEKYLTKLKSDSQNKAK